MKEYTSRFVPKGTATGTPMKVKFVPKPTVRVKVNLKTIAKDSSKKA